MPQWQIPKAVSLSGTVFLWFPFNRVVGKYPVEREGALWRIANPPQQKKRPLQCEPVNLLGCGSHPSERDPFLGCGQFGAVLQCRLHCICTGDCTMFGNSGEPITHKIFIHSSAHIKVRKVKACKAVAHRKHIVHIRHFLFISVTFSVLKWERSRLVKF